MVVKYPVKSGEWSVPLRSDELFSYYVNLERTPGTGEPRWCQPGNIEQIPGEELSGGSKMLNSNFGGKPFCSKIKPTSNKLTV